MNLVKKTVKHSKFGEGKVLSQVDNHIVVVFNKINRTFTYPDAFKTYLQIEDELIMNQILEDLKVIEEEKAGIAAEKESAAGDEGLEEMKKKSASRAGAKAKTACRANVAFRCNYCDGGKTDQQPGYDGICSDETIRTNIELKKRAGCSSPLSACRKYLKGELTRAELEALSGDDVGRCYESQLQTEWKAPAGIVQSGENKGTPIKLTQVQDNSLCILTTRDSKSTEEQRYIFAVFIVDQTEAGSRREEGYIANTGKYKLMLKEAEAHTMLFWNYYTNSHSKEAISWTTGHHKYLNDEKAVQILRDIVELKKDTDEAQFAVDFLNQFIKLNKINGKAIGEKGGALMKGDAK